MQRRAFSELDRKTKAELIKEIESLRNRLAGIGERKSPDVSPRLPMPVYRQIIKSAPSFVLLVDSERKIVYTNRYPYGKVELDLVGSDLLHFLPEDREGVVSRQIKSEIFGSIVIADVLDHGPNKSVVVWNQSCFHIPAQDITEYPAKILMPCITQKGSAIGKHTHESSQ